MQTDVCVAGVCTGTNPVVCPVASTGSCKAQGTCDPLTGVCSSPNAPDGSGCNLNNNCSTSSVCQSGTCVGKTWITCAPPDQCYNTGTCNSATGTCTYPKKPNGTTCDDGNPCTQGDACNNGVCVGTPVVCNSPPACKGSGQCNPSTGTCQYTNLPTGTPCNDGLLCTLGDQCNAGKSPS